MWTFIVCVLLINTAYTLPYRPPLHVKSLAFKGTTNANINVSSDNAYTSPPRLKLPLHVESWPFKGTTKTNINVASNNAYTSPPRLKLPLHVMPSAIKTSGQNNLARETKCPAAESIFPCLCFLELDTGKLNIDCSNVTDELQLRKIFATDFPTKQFQNLTILNNNNIQILGNGVFGSVTFEHVKIMKGSLVTVEDAVFILSNITLKTLDLRWNVIKVFPFPSLNTYINLTFLCVKGNYIETFPIFASQSLLGLCLSNNPISILPLNPYGYLPNLQHIMLSSTKIQDLPPNMFSSLHNLQTVILHSNKISRINMDTFKITSQYLQTMDFSNNEIGTVEVGAFVGIHNSIINLENNKLTVLPRDVWQRIVLQNVTLKLKGNHLTCGCDVAWAIFDPQFLTYLEDATCADGNMLTDECKPCFRNCGPGPVHESISTFLSKIFHIRF